MNQTTEKTNHDLYWIAENLRMLDECLQPHIGHWERLVFWQTRLRLDEVRGDLAPPMSGERGE